MNCAIQRVPRLLPLLLAAAFAGQASADPAPGTLPSNPVVTNGEASFAQPSSNTLVVTNGPGAIIRWDSFSLGSQASVTFNQTAGSGSAVLNRVAAGSSPSEIFGRLDSNGRVFIINPNGIVFGGTARVDVQGLVASTLNLADGDFLAGRYAFADGSGDITVRAGASLLTSARGPHGQVWLLAGGRMVTEQGSSIHTLQGQTVLAAGSRVVVTDEATGGMRFTVSTGESNTLEHYGAIAAASGAAGMFADSIVHAGRTSVAAGGEAPVAPAGRIVLAAARTVDIADGSVLDAAGSGLQSAGSIAIDAGHRVTVGRYADIGADGSAQGSAAGRIDIVGHEVVVAPGDGGFANVHARTADGATGTINIERRGLLVPATTGAYIPVSYTGGSDWLPNATFLADGSYVVVWMEMHGPAGTIWDVNYATVYARRFSASGAPLGEPFQVSEASGYQYKPAVTALADGSFLVLWSYKDDRPAPGAIGSFPSRLYGRRFGSDGQALAGDFRLDPDNVGSQTDPAVASLAGGRFLVAWSAVGGPRYRVFDADGTPVGLPQPALAPAEFTNANGTASTGYFLPDGSGFIHVYERTLNQYAYSGSSLPSSVQTRIYLRRYDAHGVALGSEFELTSSFSAAMPTSFRNIWVDGAARLANGDLVVTRRVASCATCEYKVYYSQFASDGSSRFVDRQLDLSGTNLYARVAPLADGGYVIVWEHTNALPTAGTTVKDNDVLARVFDGAGNPVGDVLSPSAGAVGGVDQPRVATSADGRFLTVWSDNLYRSSGGYTAQEVRSQLVGAPTVSAAPSVDTAAGGLPADHFATRPGLANGSYAPPQAGRPGRAATPPNTESALNPVRLVTPTALEDFVFPGAAKPFLGSVAVQSTTVGEAISYRLVDGFQGADEGVRPAGKGAARR